MQRAIVLAASVAALLPAAGASMAAKPAPALATDLGPMVAPEAVNDPRLRASVARLTRQARAHAVRLGLTPSPLARPARGAALERQERRLRGLVSFLSNRREVVSRVDRRASLRPLPRGSTVASRLAATHREAVNRSLRLGLDRPGALRVPRAPEARAAALERSRAIASWLAARRERPRPVERHPRHRFPHYEALMCIARHESNQRWDIATGNGYWGGLQMDVAFQRAYGPALYARHGTASNWTMEQQLAVAERAIRQRGFHPWPNTARYCGLL